MTAILACLGENISELDINSLVYTINPIKILDTKILHIDQGFFAVSSHENVPLKGNKYFDNEDWAAVFAGDLIEESLPWNLIFDTLKSGNYQTLNSLRGYFSLTILDKKKNKLFIISDRRSQFPVFYLINGKNVFISTELSTFCRLPLEISFNIGWMWEYLFFQYPIGQTTFLENVKRMPPASVLEIKIKSGEHFFSEYAPKFRKKNHLLKGEKALEYAYAVFKNTLPKYMRGSEEIICGLTCGWDARTNLSFCQNLGSIIAYTHGIPGCWDLVDAAKTARAMDIEHKKILLDKNFEDILPSLMIDTVYLSSGQEQITRSAPLYVYRKLTDSGEKHPILLSGIDYDFLFRGHFGPQELPYMTKIFSTGEKTVNEEYWKEYLGNHYNSFKQHIFEQLENLEKKYGKLSELETHLSYFLYEHAPKYWDGRLSISKHFITHRIPAWDTDIIDLSHSIENSMLFFSQILHGSGKRKEMILQAYMISKNGGPLRKIPIRGVTPESVLKGEIIYHFTRIKNLLPNAIVRRILRRKTPPPEDWKRWLNDVHKEFIDYLIFSENSRIHKYIEDQCLEKLKNKRDIRIISKFATIEIILRLIENKWERFGV